MTRTLMLAPAMAALLLVATSEPGHAAATCAGGPQVDDAIAMAQAECCPAVSQRAYTRCARPIARRLIREGQLQRSCRSAVLSAGCPGGTTTTTAAPTTTTSSTTTTLPPTTTTSSTTSTLPPTTTTSTTAPPTTTT